MTQPKIIVLVGLPGSGKSTWLANRGVTALSSDETRRLLIDDPTNQTIHRRVFAALRYLVRQRLQLGRPETYVDATNLTRRDRRPWIKLAGLHGADVEAVFFDVPIEICQQRNRARQRVVPEEAILEMARRLTPPTVDEGFTKVTIFRPN